MAMDKKEQCGGAAFARSAYGLESGDFASGSQTGMTLRDYFAAKAMQSLIVTEEYTYPFSMSTNDKISEMAYYIADAMLKERNK